MCRVQWRVCVKTVIGSRFQDTNSTQAKVGFKHAALHGSVPSAFFKILPGSYQQNILRSCKFFVKQIMQFYCKVGTYNYFK